MADFSTDARGGIDDRVRLELGGREVLIAESYEVSASILSQPARFSLRLGSGATARELAVRFRPNTPFKLYVGDTLQQTGHTDGFHLDQSVGATEITIFGRNDLAPLHDGEVESEESHIRDTFDGLVRKALVAVGIDPTRLKSSAAAKKPVPTVSHMQTRVGDRWYSFLRRYLDRGGLFLWCKPDGTFSLDVPNIKQPPTYRILRRRGATRNAVNVLRAAWAVDTSQRHSSITVYARSGGRKFGCSQAVGAVIDDQMVNDPPDPRSSVPARPDSAFGIKNRVRTVRDSNVSSIAQAEHLANRLLAEERRESWRLEYTLAGHTTPSLVNGGGRAVWTPDTLVEVVDDEFGLNDTYWIESVEHRRAPQTETTIRLLRRKDCLFGTSETEE